MSQTRATQTGGVHDLVIRNAMIYDGSGAPGVLGAVAVDGDRITQVGANIGAGRQEIDAKGLALMPGIIDGHTHYDAQLTWDAFADPSPQVGVTTVVIGNCGFTIAPCRPADRDLTMRNLTHVEGMSLDALRTGIVWDFESIPQYMDQLQRQGVGPNVAAFAGHSAIRTFVMREDAAKRAATDDEIAQMAAIVRDAMAHGAVGFATSTNEPHNGENGIPMPSRMADDKEMRALVNAMGESGRGLFMLTKGSRTSVPFLESIAADSGRPVLIAAMFHSNTAPDSVFNEIAQMDAACQRGHTLYPQVSCCPLTMDFTMHSPYVFEGIEAWLPAMQVHGAQAQRGVYSDQAFRGQVKDALHALRGKRLFNSEWDKVTVMETVRDQNRQYEGRTVDTLAADAGKHPLDWLLDLSLDENLDTLFTAQLRNNDVAAVSRLINHPTAHVSLSDAGAHLTFLCDAAFGLHLLGYWSREVKAITLPAAVNKLTAHPAKIFGIRDRGTIRAGAYADLLLFDPASVGRGANLRVHDLPADAPRLTAQPLGVKGVWINGKLVADGNGMVDNAPRAGQVLREFNA